MADGEVKLKLSAETQQAGKDLQAFGKEIDKLDAKAEKLQSKLDKLKTERLSKDTTSPASEQIQQTIRDIDEEKKRLKGLKNELNEVAVIAGKMSLDNPELKKLLELSNRPGFNAGLTSAHGKRMGVDPQEFQAFKELTDEVTRYNKLIAVSEQRLSGMNDVLNTLRQGATQFATPKSAEEIEVEKQLVDTIRQKADAERQYMSAKEAYESKVAKEMQENQAYEQRQRVMSALRKSTSLLATTLARATSNATKFVLSLPLNVVKKRFDKLTHSVKRFGQRLKYVILQGLLFRNLRKYLSEFASSIGSAFKQNEQFNASLANLKGTFWAAIAPVIDALAPIIARFLDMIARLITYLSGLIGILFKIGKASKTAGAGLASAGKSGKEASKNLASWDTIQNLDDGSGGSADSGISPTFGQDFEEAYTALDKFRELIEKGDWFEIGKYVGEKLNELITTIDNWITGTLAPKIQEWATNAAQFLNGFLTGVDWKNVGKTLSDIIITLFNGISTWLSEVDWELVGRSVRDFLLGIDWGGILKAVGKAIGSAIIGGIEFIEGLTGLDLSWLIDGFNSLIEIITTLGDVLSGETTLKEWWNNLSDGQAIIAVILGIAGAIAAVVAIISVVTTIVGGIGTAISLLTSPIGLVVLAVTALIAIIVLCIKHWDEIKTFAIKVWEAIKKAVTDAITAIRNWFVKAYEDISAFLQRIVTWIDEKIILPIVNFYVNALKKIGEVTYNIINKIKEWWEGVKTKITNVWIAIKKGVSEKIQAIRETVWTAVSKIKGWWEDVKTKVNGVWSSIKKKASEAWEGIKSVFKAVPKWFEGKFKSAWEAVKNVFSTGGKIFSGIKDGIVNAFVAVVNTIIDGINRVVSIPFNAINDVLRSIKNVNILGVKPFTWIGTISVPQIPKLQVSSQGSSHGGGGGGTQYAGVRSIGDIGGMARLAQGTVVNPGHEFAAILGDNRYEQEVVSPLSTMKQAFIEAMQEVGGDGSQVILQLDGRKLATAIIPHINNKTKAYGRSVIL